MKTEYTYLALMLGTLLFPAVLSFDRKVRFREKWKYLPLPLMLTASYFIVWDYFFANQDIWSFNDKYILGPRILLLPVEEWMFFFIVPFACLFIYECLNTFLKKDWFGPYVQVLSWTLAGVLLAVALLNMDKRYTAVSFFSMAAALLVNQLWLKPAWMGRFYMAYLVSLLPFFVINGILTALPVVSYAPADNLGIRLFTIPMEDSVYLLLLLWMNTALYEWLKSRSNPLY